MHRFLLVIEKADGNYSAYTPDLPGCAATGDPREEIDRSRKCAGDLEKS